MSTKERHKIEPRWPQISCREIHSRKYRKLYRFSFKGNELSIFPLHRYEITHIKHDHNIKFCWIKAQMEFIVIMPQGGVLVAAEHGGF